MKVMIVDDEVLARVGIKSIVPWGEHGFQVVGEADNGQHALAMMRELDPDIVLTDIRMPVLDGIELIRAAQEAKLRAKFVVISSYGDLSYVKDAMRQGAADYLIKLELQSESLMELMNRLRERILEENANAARSSVADSVIHDNIGAARQRILQNIVSGLVYDREEITEALARLDIQLPEEELTCMLLHAEHEGVPSSNGSVRHRTMMNIVEEMLEPIPFSYAIPLQQGEIVILVARSAGSASAMAGRLRDAIREYMNMAVTIGISDCHDSYDGIGDAYRQAEAAMNTKFLHRKGSIIVFKPPMQSIGDKEMFTDLTGEIRKLEKGVELYDAPNVTASLNFIIAQIRDNPQLKKDEALIVCNAVWFAVHSRLRSNFESREMFDFNSVLSVQSLSFIEEYIEWLEQMKLAVVSLIAGFGERKRLIMQAKQLINTSYREELSLETVADKLGISAKYLSILFKKETGSNYVDYITDIRIKYAKILLRGGEYRVYEVGQRVGYDNEQYFSRVFKKITGLSPNQYRHGMNEHHQGE
ncbi:hypothetical protein SY83_05310 [Paenibacillus swuensis]|uniref:AraC family transcriptional regulator n=1 Tax=Paenibacillus swuensis TaxID=1178515 RepID=A0A172TFT0_9BACL|nr:response regulator [Paenibacillus swuensis]ANE45812.1 hypothetical protein SY83_05310 [Paenibacillus swuensis]